MLLGYTRVSTQEQAEDNRSSLAEQKRKIQGVALMRNVPKEECRFFSDPGISGGTPLSIRPAGAEMLAAAQQGDVVCAAKLDRIFRSASDALTTVETLSKRGVKLILADIGTEPVDENGVSKLFFAMLSAFAEFERGRIAERIQEGKAAKRKRMGHTGGIVPYGYAIEGHGREAMLVPIEHEQEIVRRVRALNRRYKPAEITRILNETGCRNRLGGHFEIYQVWRLIHKSSIEKQTA